MASLRESMIAEAIRAVDLSDARIIIAGMNDAIARWNAAAAHEHALD
jgi:hypothetical protein